jgi:oligoribonuclease NrnB/cAMP/cGMP phosphodiesterase (DHH superfamily)
MYEELVIYHKNCFDGMTAAYVVRRYFALHTLPMPECIGANYGDAPPDVKGKRVTIVDFSWPREILQKMARDAESMLVLDHHETAQNDLVGLPYTVFDMERSGAGITWDWFFTGQPRHWLVNCVEDRDLWRFNLPDTRAQMNYISTVLMNWNSWEDLWISNPKEVAEKGSYIGAYIENYGRKAGENAVMIELGGYTFPLINIAYMNCSDHLDALIKRSVFDRAASFFMRADLKWQFSLRSGKSDINVAKIAQEYGGGGHAHAAGFQMDWEAFVQLMRGVKETR